MKRIQIRLEEQQFKALQRLAREQGLPVAEMVRQSIDALLRSVSQPSREALRSRALSVVGRFHSGASDISSRHDRHLENAYKE